MTLLLKLLMHYFLVSTIVIYGHNSCYKFCMVLLAIMWSNLTYIFDSLKTYKKKTSVKRNLEFIIDYSTLFS